MHISEAVAVPSGLLGRAKLELIHPRTGKSLKSVEVDNYISAAQLNHNRWAQRQEYRNTVASTDAQLTSGLLTRVVLSTSDMSQATGEIFAPGQITAWASPNDGTADATRKGSFTSGESSMTALQAAYVFEWPTTSGNGFIRSIYWANFSSTAPSMTYTNPSFTAGLTATLHSSRRPAVWYDGAGGLWVMGTAGLTKMNWTPTYEGSLAPSIAFSGPTNAQMGLTTLYDLVGDGTNIYAVGTGASTIRKFATPTGPGDVTETAITVTGVSAPSAITYDGTYLWVGWNGQTVYRVDKSSGAIERSFSIAWSGYTPISIAWYPPKNCLLVSYFTSGFSNWIRGYDLDGTVICEWYAAGNSQASPSQDHGLCYVGQVTDSRNPGFSYDGFLLRDGHSSDTGYTAPGRVLMPGPVATYATLGTEVEKTNLTAMKLTYTFTFT